MLLQTGAQRPNYSPEVLAAFESVQLVAEHIKNADKDREVVEDWKYVAMVFDRFFLYVFTIACVSGACIILLQAPSLYDSRVPLDLNQLQDSVFPVPPTYPPPPPPTVVAST